MARPPSGTGRASTIGTRNGLGSRSAHGTTAVPAAASAYNVSNQPTGSPAATPSAASARARVRSGAVIALQHVAPLRAAPRVALVGHRPGEARVSCEGPLTELHPGGR